jgi:hypothetical protein
VEHPGSGNAQHPTVLQRRRRDEGVPGAALRWSSGRRRPFTWRGTEQSRRRHARPQLLLAATGTAARLPDARAGGHPWLLTILLLPLSGGGKRQSSSGAQERGRRRHAGWLSRSATSLPSPLLLRWEELGKESPGGGGQCKSEGRPGFYTGVLGLGEATDGRQRAIWGGVARIHGRQRGRGQHPGEAAVRLARCCLRSGRQQKEGERGIVPLADTRAPGGGES